jgi:signal transduction histidine kinase
VTTADRVLIFDTDPDRGASIARLLEQSRPWSSDGSVLAFHDLNAQDYGPSPEVVEVQAGLPTLLIVVESGGSAGAPNHLADVARRQGVATLLIVSEVGDPKGLVGRARKFDAWMVLGSVDQELPARVAMMLDRVHQKWSSRAKLSAIDARFLAVVIHDLRTPLNVIGLTIAAISRSVPGRNPALEEDMTFLQDNSKQIKEMLELLSDYCKLMDVASPLPSVEFDPRRFLTDFCADRHMRASGNSRPLRLEIEDSCPTEVALDQVRALLALKLAFENAVIAADQAPIRIRSSGEADRWIIELSVECPPPENLVSMPLRADSFERITGSPQERRGLDLAVATRISELFGGNARLVVEPNRRSTLVLDWPLRLQQ